ncbi:hypothetical protein ANN_09842 [Periplaneta americana]|uniref:Uncharacterized protein n=1 Tax=Periplaneta americana TaxID=6978 RepID=A0ABQ8TME5_PERAM|nr:hypothetical protein ANN_09842 [Periplaneta americana]
MGFIIGEDSRNKRNVWRKVKKRLKDIDRQITEGECRDKVALEDPIDDQNKLGTELYLYGGSREADVERSFSAYKVILSDTRRSFSFETLKLNVVVYCSSNRNQANNMQEKGKFAAVIASPSNGVECMQRDSLARGNPFSAVTASMEERHNGRQHSLKCAKGKRCRPVCTVVQQGEVESIPLAATSPPWCTVFSADKRR